MENHSGVTKGFRGRGGIFADIYRCCGHFGALTADLHDEKSFRIANVANCYNVGF